MAGRITTGFSKPYVAKYTYGADGVKYTGATVLARGVDVTISPETNDDNNFYADNAIAESEAGTLTGGNLSLTIDGLTDDGAKLIYGTPDADEEGWTAYGEETKIPEVGFGFIARVQHEGTTYYVPNVIARVRFSLNETSAATGEETISWQTQSLEATILRSENANKDWKYVGAEYETEDAAVTALTTFFGKTFA